MAVDAQPSGVTVVVHGITEAEANADSLRWRGHGPDARARRCYWKNSRSRWRSQCAARWHP
jgi:hypothetical protein